MAKLSSYFTLIQLVKILINIYLIIKLNKNTRIIIRFSELGIGIRIFSYLHSYALIPESFSISGLLYEKKNHTNRKTEK